MKTMIKCIIAIMMLWTMNAYAAKASPDPWAAYSPPNWPAHASPWHLLGSNDRGTYYVSSYRSPMMGFAFTVKELVQGMSGKTVTVVLNDFLAECGKDGQPPDVVYSLGFVEIDTITGAAAQTRSPEMRGTPVMPKRDDVLGVATRHACMMSILQ